jgi:rare lipoprotein A
MRSQLVLAAAVWLVLACILVSGCASAGGGKGMASSQIGVASYYAEKYHGRKTASGEAFDMNRLTAAHRTLPFGTRVRVTNLSNGKSVTVRINDRGPFVQGRIIDLSRAAAARIDMVRAGVVKVKIDILEGRTASLGRE